MIFKKLAATPIPICAMSCPANASPEEKNLSPPTLGQAEAPRVEAPDWRRVIVTALVVEGVFFLFYLGATFLPLLIWPGSLVFSPAGFLLGRKSRRPWLEGALYGLLTTAVVALLLFLTGFPWGVLYALFLVLPQGILGTWLGSHFFSAQSDASR